MIPLLVHILKMIQVAVAMTATTSKTVFLEESVHTTIKVSVHQEAILVLIIHINFGEGVENGIFQ